MTRVYAVALADGAHAFTLLVFRRADGHEVWGDAPERTPRWSDVPELATARLNRTGTYVVVGDWREVPAVQGGAWWEIGATWRADVDIRSGPATSPRVAPARAEY